jgi:S1-C subfamily serine protease/cytochrome c-type biogenesis protein CcmH/NrfG
MSVRVRCPKCGTAAEFSESLLGEIVQCPSCRQRLKLNKPACVAPEKDAARHGCHETRAPQVSLSHKQHTSGCLVFAWVAALVLGTLLALILLIAIQTRNATSPEETPSAQKSSLLNKSAEENGKAARQDRATTTAKTGAIVEKVAPGVGKPAPVVGQQAKEVLAKPLTPLDPLDEILALPTAQPKGTKPNPYQKVLDLAESAITGKPLKQEPLKPLTPEALYAMASPAVVKLTALNYKSEEIGQGTGFFVRPDGWIVTNHHVIRDAKYVSLTTATGKSARADWVIAWDEKADLAILVINDGATMAPPPTNINDFDKLVEIGKRMETLGPKLFGGTKMLTCLELAPAEYKPAIGSKVWAIGNPQGLANSLSEGIVSGLRSEGGVTQVQCTAAVSPGSSGGPLLDCYGRVLGVMKSIHTDEERLSQNLNFAVSSEAVRGLLSRADRATPQQVGKVRKSINCEETLAEMLADAEKNPGEAWRWDNLGSQLNLLKRWAEARDAYRKSIRLKPNNADALFGLAEAQWGLGDYAGVNESLKRAVDIEPNVVKYKALLGGFYESTGRSELAIRVLQEAIQLDPRSCEVRSRLIFVLFNVGKYADALLQCDELERLDPVQGRNVRNIILTVMKSNEK